MRNIILAFLIISGNTAANAQFSSGKALLELSKKKFQWMILMQYDSLESILDDRMIFVHSNGWSETKTEFIQDIKLGKLRYNSIDVVESSVRLYQGSAVIIGRGKFRVTLEGKDLEFDLKYTEFYIRERGKWLLASRHANRLH